MCASHVLHLNAFAWQWSWCTVHRIGAHCASCPSRKNSIRMNGLRWRNYIYEWNHMEFGVWSMTRTKSWILGLKFRLKLFETNTQPFRALLCIVRGTVYMHCFNWSHCNYIEYQLGDCRFPFSQWISSFAAFWWFAAFKADDKKTFVKLVEAPSIIHGKKSQIAAHTLDELSVCCNRLLLSLGSSFCHTLIIYIFRVYK